MRQTKKIIQIAKAIFPITLLLLLANCSEEVTPDDTLLTGLEKEQAVIIEKLSAFQWSASSFTRDNVDAFAEFTNLKLTFGNKTYSSQNGLHVWPSSGSWQFVEGKSDQVTRDDGIIIDVEVDDTSLTLSFKFDENIFTTGGREQSISSSLVFVLNK